MKQVGHINRPSPEPLFSLKDRLEHGILKPQEVWVLAGKARTTFYEDVKAGKVTLRKIGLRSSGVFGPDAKRYIESCLRPNSD